MSSMLASNESTESLLNASSPTNPTFQPSFPLQHIPDMNFSQGNDMSMTSYPMFMNSTYSQESKQINNLQEHTKFLKAQVMRLTIENNTLRMAFQCLAGSVDAGTSFSQASKPKEEPCLTQENHLLIQFWYQEDWDRYLESPEGRLSASSCKFIHELMENNYLMFKFVHNEWKLDYLASTNYPAWQKTNLDNSGRWKLKKGKGPKLEDKNNSTDEISKKWKLSHHTFKSEELEKKFRGSYKGDNNITWSSSTTSLSPPPSDSSASLGSVQPSSELSSEDFPPEMLCILPLPSVDVSQGSQSNFKAATEMQLGASPILKLADAILPAPISTVPAAPEDNSATSVSKSAKGSTKAKINLCAHCWCKQIQSSRSTEEFQKYYNNLGAEQ
ncbi:hypothetical protein V8B97DRAFT_2023558 [Scleroderma yunnanense]